MMIKHANYSQETMFKLLHSQIETTNRKNNKLWHKNTNFELKMETTNFTTTFTRISACCDYQVINS